MSGHMSVAAGVRASKERHPENYCSNVRCLWRTVNGRTGEATPCPKHATQTAEEKK